MNFRERKAAREYGKSWQMPFMEPVPFVYFGVRFGDWAWKKAGISSVIRQSQKSRATGLKSTIFRTNRKLKNNIHALIVSRDDFTRDFRGARNQGNHNRFASEALGSGTMKGIVFERNGAAGLSLLVYEVSVLTFGPAANASEADAFVAA
jgi:hypothetical protein